MKLKYNHDIFTEEIPLTTDKPTSKSFATQHGNKTCYAPLAETAADAFALHIIDDGDMYSVQMPTCYRLYYADGTVETAPAGTALDLNDYSGVIKALSNSNGTITANNAGTAIGGKNVSLIGGVGDDVFLYKGGTMNISSYGSNDKVSLASGYTITSNAIDETKNEFTLIVTNGTDTNTIAIESVTKDNLKSIKVNINGSDETITIPYTQPMIFDKTNPASATQVTVNVQTADFGVFSVSGGIETSPTTSIGTEYYGELLTITATKENSTIVGNSKANTFYIKGGDSNILTGGIGKDTFIFESGGGVITDFGIGTTKSGGNKVLAMTTKRTNTSTYVGYNRDDPTSYFQYRNTLQVKGTVVEIAFRHDVGDYDSSTESSFTAYVTYVADGKYSTIALANIAKKATKTDKLGGGKNAVYATNLDQMQQQVTEEGTTYYKPIIYDTRTGTSAQLTDTTRANLFVDKSDSAYSSNIARLDAIIQARGITTYSADGKVASVSNGIVNAYVAQQEGTS